MQQKKAKSAQKSSYFMQFQQLKRQFQQRQTSKSDLQPYSGEKYLEIEGDAKSLIQSIFLRSPLRQYFVSTIITLIIQYQPIGKFTIYRFSFISMDNKYGHKQMLRVFIIGTTAVGKTKLSVQIAKKIKGQIISSDSKQLYKDASIMTAKVTQQQAQNIPHYMVDCLNLHQNMFNRNKYFRDARKALMGIEQRKKSGIIVGGTNYYTQTLLFNLKNLSDDKPQSQGGESSDEGQDKKLIKDKQLNEEQKKEIQAMKKLKIDEKYDLLLKYDKPMALKTHRNDQNRITQFLQRIISGGKIISSSYQKFTAELRHSNSLVFWVRNSDKQELLDMVTKRVHKMLDKNGLTEIFAIYYYIEMYNMIKDTKTLVKNIQEYSGAASSIGIRQFKELYLEVRQQLNQMFQQSHLQFLAKKELDYAFIHNRIYVRFGDLKYSEQTLARGKSQLILDTKHYCKRQITWIRNRMFVDQPENKKHFFVLELSQQEGEQKLPVMERFDKQVAKKAFQIIDAIQNEGFGSVLEDEKEFAPAAKTESIEEWKKFYCQACELEVNGSYDWKCHIQSKRHIKQEKYLQKKEERQKHIQEQRAKAQSKKKTQKQPNKKQL